MASKLLPIHLVVYRKNRKQKNNFRSQKIFFKKYLTWFTIRVHTNNILFQFKFQVPLVPAPPLPSPPLRLPLFWRRRRGDRKDTHQRWRGLHRSQGPNVWRRGRRNWGRYKHGRFRGGIAGEYNLFRLFFLRFPKVLISTLASPKKYFFADFGKFFYVSLFSLFFFYFQADRQPLIYSHPPEDSSSSSFYQHHHNPAAVSPNGGGGATLQNAYHFNTTNNGQVQ